MLLEKKRLKKNVNNINIFIVLKHKKGVFFDIPIIPNIIPL